MGLGYNSVEDLRVLLAKIQSQTKYDTEISIKELPVKPLVSTSLQCEPVTYVRRETKVYAKLPKITYPN